MQEPKIRVTKPSEVDRYTRWDNINHEYLEKLSSKKLCSHIAESPLKKLLYVKCYSYCMC